MSRKKTPAAVRIFLNTSVNPTPLHAVPVTSAGLIIKKVKSSSKKEKSAYTAIG
jgi:hypothetical protein